MTKLLEVDQLNVDFEGDQGYINVVSDLSFQVEKGQVLGIVGESGSGKSVTSLAIMRLLPARTARVQGRIHFGQEDLLQLSESQMQQVRGNRIAMIFQEPMTSLNPIHSCGKQISEALLLHKKADKKAANAKALELLETCGIPDAARRMKEYPHQLSGGMRQRVMIAMALACDPELLIADEPTTALDVTIEAQILKLLKDIKEKRDMGVIFITHDLGIVSDFCNRVAVMYCGEMVENASVQQLFQQPLHPYSQGLIAALPRLGLKKDRLEAIEGMVPDADKLPAGCRFHPRCKSVMERCKQEQPQLKQQADGRQVRCFLYDKE